MLRPSVILFDLDGTLTASEVGIVGSFRHALNEMGLDTPAELVRSCIGPPLAIGFASLGVPEDRIATAIELYRARFSTIGIYQNELYPGVVTMLTNLTDRGLVLAVATAKPSKFARIIVDHFQIGAYFSVVAGASFDRTRLLKLDVVRHALDRLGEPERSEVALVGDRGDDVAAAVQLGLHPIGATWGYGSRTELTDNGARYLVDHPDAVVALVAGEAGTTA